MEQLKTILFKLTAIPVNEQILLCDGQALKQKTLEENGLTVRYNILGNLTPIERQKSFSL